MHCTSTSISYDALGGGDSELNWLIFPRRVRTCRAWGDAQRQRAQEFSRRRRCPNRQQHHSRQMWLEVQRGAMGHGLGSAECRSKASARAPESRCNTIPPSEVAASAASGRGCRESERGAHALSMDCAGPTRSPSRHTACIYAS